MNLEDFKLSYFKIDKEKIGKVYTFKSSYSHTL